jgi:hypothetical protein
MMVKQAQLSGSADGNELEVQALASGFASSQCRVRLSHELHRLSQIPKLISWALGGVNRRNKVRSVPVGLSLWGHSLDDRGLHIRIKL